MDKPESDTIADIDQLHTVLQNYVDKNEYRWNGEPWTISLNNSSVFTIIPGSQKQFSLRVKKVADSKFVWDTPASNIVNLGYWPSTWLYSQALIYIPRWISGFEHFSASSTGIVRANKTGSLFDLVYPALLDKITDLNKDDIEKNGFGIFFKGSYADFTSRKTKNKLLLMAGRDSILYSAEYGKAEDGLIPLPGLPVELTKESELVELIYWFTNL